MANVIDLSNAVITAGPVRPTNATYLGLTASGGVRNSAGELISTNINDNTYRFDTDDGMVVDKRGKFTAAGTEFYIGASSSLYWKVSGISFEVGDIYGFTVQVTLPVAEESD